MKKVLFLLIILCLAISGCSSSTNTSTVDEDEYVSELEAEESDYSDFDYWSEYITGGTGTWVAKPTNGNTEDTYIQFFKDGTMKELGISNEYYHTGTWTVDDDILTYTWDDSTTFERRLQEYERTGGFFMSWYNDDQDLFIQLDPYYLTIDQIMEQRNQEANQ